MTRSSIDQNIIIIFSEHLRAENSAGPDVDSICGDDPDNDDKEAEPSSKVLAHVELARSVREFGPPHWQSRNVSRILILWCFRTESPRYKYCTSNQSTFPSGAYSTILI